MSALGDARAQLAANLDALGIEVRESASTGHMSPPAALITPGSEWVQPQVVLGSTINARVQLTVTLVVGRIAAGASLAELESLLEQVLPALTPQQWILGPIAEPFAVTIAGTEYLACSATITKALVIA